MKRRHFLTGLFTPLLVLLPWRKPLHPNYQCSCDMLNAALWSGVHFELKVSNDSIAAHSFSVSESHPMQRMSVATLEMRYRHGDLLCWKTCKSFDEAIKFLWEVMTPEDKAYCLAGKCRQLAQASDNRSVK